MLKKLLIICGVITLFIIAVGSFAFFKISKVSTTSIDIPQTIDFEVKAGSSLYKVKNDLAKFVEIDDLGFRLWLKLNPEYSDIKAGLYEIQANANLIDVINMMNEGRVKQFSITLIEGLTFKLWTQALKANQHIQYDIKSESSLYAQLMQSVGDFCANQYQKLEGCFLPDTYFFTKGTKASEILARAYSAMQALINTKWDMRFLDVPIKTQYEALILASIIEKETAIESERNEIAGVFANRLEKNMRLQTDPTVIYGIGDEFDGNITRKHLRQPTPYNTYVIKGLPITPIAMANRASILAALQPAITDSLYFVATGDGGHQFSTNLADHNKAVQAYLRKLKNNKE